MHTLTYALLGGILATPCAEWVRVCAVVLWQGIPAAEGALSPTPEQYSGEMLLIALLAQRGVAWRGPQCLALCSACDMMLC